MCTVLLPPGVNPIAVKYININIDNKDSFFDTNLPEDGLLESKHVEHTNEHNLSVSLSSFCWNCMTEIIFSAPSVNDTKFYTEISCLNNNRLVWGALSLL
jgi:hypothetical protein